MGLTWTTPGRGQRLLVTGGGGFVGKNLVTALSAAGYDVLAPSRASLDLRDRGAVERWLHEHPVEAVVHAAGKVGGIAANVADPVGFYVDNVLVGTSVVLAADAAGIERLVNLSSSCTYPRDRERLVEEDILSGPLEPTNEGYALAKAGTDRLCEWLSATRPGRDYRTLVPCNLYGPHDHFDGPGAHLVAAAFAKTRAALAEGRDEIEIWGDGTARREFMHVDDLASAVLHMLPRLAELPPRLNIGAGVDHTVDRYHAAVARVVGWEGTFVHDRTRPVGMRRKLLDVSRAAALGWQAAIGLEAGLIHTYRWLVAHDRPAAEAAA